MANLSKIKREKMLDCLEKLKEINNDDENIRAITEIENALNEKKYGLVWEEHSEKVDEMLEHNIPIFVEDVNRKITANENEPYNFLLEGDNLHSLKLLEKTHKGKIDVIYIDPPYNTGYKDFIYDDCFVDKTDGYAHSKWLSFMEKRLVIARELLRDEGVIFISIDDNEQAQLKLLCDSVFGEDNFIGEYIKQSKVGGGNDSKFIVKEHEYCKCYAKNINATKPMNIKHDKEYLKRYKEEDSDGKYFWDTFARPGLKNPIIYDIIAPDGSVINNGWIRSKERFDREYAEGKIRLLKKKNGQWSVQFKQYLNMDGKTPRSMTMDFGGTTDGDSELKNIFGKKIFNYPKSIKYLKTLLSTINNKKVTILDFFAGSGTTGHAVMQLNKEDGGNRKYILCTNNENNICEEVTYQRLKNIQKELPHNLKYYKTEFIPKFSDDEESISEKMMKHIRELIELEYAIELDGKKNIILDDEDKLDEIIPKIENDGKLFVRSGIFLSRSNQRMLEEKGVSIIEIPEYYFREELKEVGEL